MRVHERFPHQRSIWRSMARHSWQEATWISTSLGKAVLADSLDYMETLADESIDLIVTSPPFGLVRKKDYGNADAADYVDWFRAFGSQFRRILKPQGSLVIDIGGSWTKGQPTRSLYHFRLLIMLCDVFRFHLAQEFYWWNPSKLPTPAEWVNIRRIRVKDAVNSVYWLSPTPWPKATNRRVLQPYSKSMRSLLRNGYRAKKRPSGHDISTKFSRNNGAAIPPNLIAIAHTESNAYYQRYCKEHGIQTPSGAVSRGTARVFRADAHRRGRHRSGPVRRVMRYRRSVRTIEEALDLRGDRGGVLGGGQGSVR